MNLKNEIIENSDTIKIIISAFAEKLGNQVYQKTIFTLDDYNIYRDDEELKTRRTVSDTLYSEFLILSPILRRIYNDSMKKTPRFIELE